MGESKQRELAFQKERERLREIVKCSGLLTGPIHDSDLDPDITVSLTDLNNDEIPYCIHIEIKNSATVDLWMHTRSAIDLQRKLSLAISNFIFNAHREKR